MAWWLQGDLQPFAHFRSGMGRSPDLAPCRGWVRGREQSEANEKWAACERATRR